MLTYRKARQADPTISLPTQGRQGGSMDSGNRLKVLIVASNASYRWGGEAVLPLHIFRGLRDAGHDAWLCTGNETESELEGALGPYAEFVEYVDDRKMHSSFRQIQAALPRWLGSHPLYYVGALITQFRLRSAVKRIVKDRRIDLVHQPTPVSPRTPTFLPQLHVPLVLGPMNGGMEYPPGFRKQAPLPVRALRSFGRFGAMLANWMFPGKRKADCLLVANERTRWALPSGVKGQIIHLVENGVDPDLWLPNDGHGPPGAPFQLMFLGRLESWKGTHWLIEAVAKASSIVPCKLRIVGGDVNGERERLEKQVEALGVTSHIEFLGELPQRQCAELLRASDALILPSIFECGGAVVLEAMASARPVIAVDWGGPSDYLNSSCGVLIPPKDPASLVVDLTSAIVDLALNRDHSADLGRAGRDRVMAEYTWPAKIERLVGVYRELIAHRAA